MQQIEASVCVRDPDPEDAIAKIELFEDGTVVEISEKATEWKINRTPEPGKHYYFVKVTQADGNPLWSAPVWVNVEK